MKYIDADRLCAEIKRQIRFEELNFAALGGGGQTFCINTLEWVLKRIDSLQQEQPEVDLEKEIKDKYSRDTSTLKTREQYAKLASHFYELGIARKEK